jgi:hypothetical protein
VIMSRNFRAFFVYALSPRPSPVTPRPEEGVSGGKLGSRKGKVMELTRKKGEVRKHLIQLLVRVIQGRRPF